MRPGGDEGHFGDSNCRPFSVHKSTVQAFGNRVFFWSMRCSRVKCDTHVGKVTEEEFGKNSLALSHLSPVMGGQSVCIYV